MQADAPPPPGRRSRSARPPARLAPPMCGRCPAEDSAIGARGQHRLHGRPAAAVLACHKPLVEFFPSPPLACFVKPHDLKLSASARRHFSRHQPLSGVRRRRRRQASGLVEIFGDHTPPISPASRPRLDQRRAFGAISRKSQRRTHDSASTSAARCPSPSARRRDGNAGRKDDDQESVIILNVGDQQRDVVSVCYLSSHLGDIAQPPLLGERVRCSASARTRGRGGEPALA